MGPMMIDGGGGVVDAHGGGRNWRRYNVGEDCPVFEVLSGRPVPGARSGFWVSCEWMKCGEAGQACRMELEERES
ncbi:hypothetical protein AKJ16_DCAP22176 [Drosera capensis]